MKPFKKNLMSAFLLFFSFHVDLSANDLLDAESETYENLCLFIKKRNKELTENKHCWELQESGKIHSFHVDLDETKKEIYYKTLEDDGGGKLKESDKVTIQLLDDFSSVMTVYSALCRGIEEEYSKAHSELSYKKYAWKFADGAIPMSLLALVKEEGSDISSIKNLATTSLILKASFRFYDRISNIFYSMLFTPFVFRLSKERLREEMLILSLMSVLSLNKEKRTEVVFEERIKRILDYVTASPVKRTAFQYSLEFISSIFLSAKNKCRGYRAHVNDASKTIDEEKRGKYYYSQNLEFIRNLPSYNFVFYENYDKISDKLRCVFESAPTPPFQNFV